MDIDTYSLSLHQLAYHIPYLFRVLYPFQFKLWSCLISGKQGDRTDPYELVSECPG